MGLYQIFSDRPQPYQPNGIPCQHEVTTHVLNDLLLKSARGCHSKIIYVLLLRHTVKRGWTGFAKRGLVIPLQIFHFIEVMVYPPIKCNYLSVNSRK